MKNRVGGMIRSLVRTGSLPSVADFRAAIPTDLIPLDRWPTPGRLLRIPQVVMLQANNLYDQNFSSGSTTVETPNLGLPAAFVEARSIIESARPGRTFVLMQGYGVPRISNASQYSQYPAIDQDIPIVISERDFEPELLVLTWGSPNPFGNFGSTPDFRYQVQHIRDALPVMPSLACRVWDDGRKVFQSGVLQPTLSDTIGTRVNLFRSLGLDYQFMGVSPAPVTGGDIAAMIAGHFGFSL